MDLNFSAGKRNGFWGRAAFVLCGFAFNADTSATTLVNPQGNFLNDFGQAYPSNPALQFDSRLMLRNTINGGAIAVGDEWVLHVYHSVFPHNSTSGVDGYVGQLMDQFDNDGSAHASYRVVASRESLLLDFALFKVAKIANGGTTAANFPIWVDAREIYPAQPGIALWGSFGPQRITFDNNGNPIQDPPHPRGVKWGTTGADGFSTPGLPSDVAAVAGDSGSGIFVRDGFNLRLLATDGAPITPLVRQQLDQWAFEMGGALARYPLQTGTYSTARLAGIGDWSDGTAWTAGIPTADSSVWIDNGAIVELASATPRMRSVYVGVGQHGLSGVGLIRMINQDADLDAGSIILGVGENSTAGVVTQLAGICRTDSLIVGYRGAGTYSQDGGTLSVAGELVLGRDPGSHGTFNMRQAGQAPSHMNVQSLVVGRESSGWFSQEAGTTQVDGDLIVGKAAGGNGMFQLAGGTVVVGDSLRIGQYRDASGAFVQSGGALIANSGHITRGSFEISAGSAAFDFATLASGASMRLLGGDLRFINGSDLDGTLDFGSTTTNLSAGGLSDLSACTILNSSAASLTALPGGLVILPATAPPNLFASMSSEGAIVHIAGSTIDVIAQTHLQLRGTLQDFLIVRGSVTATPGPGGASLFLRKGFRVEDAGLLELGDGGAARLMVNSANSNGAVSGGSMQIYAFAEFAQTGGTTSFAGPITVEKYAKLSMAGGELSAPTLNVSGRADFSAGEIDVEDLNLLGQLHQTGGAAAIDRLFSPEPFQLQHSVGVAGGLLTVGALKIGTLRLDAHGVVRLDPNAILAQTHQLRDLSFGDGASISGTLDIATEQLVVDYETSSPFSSLAAAVRSGYDDGTWQGPGIVTSSTGASSGKHGIGIAEASALGLTSFGGVNLVDPNDPSAPITALLLSYTLFGDTDLDGTVSIGDFSRLAANFNLPGTWTRGDFNYDQTINVSDFATLAANFNQSFSASIVNSLNPQVPEPVATLLAGVLLARRIRRS